MPHFKLKRPELILKNGLFLLQHLDVRLTSLKNISINNTNIIDRNRMKFSITFRVRSNQQQCFCFDLPS